MTLIDTHIHIYSDDYKADLDEVMQAAQYTGIQTMFLPAIDSSHFAAMQACEAQFGKERIQLMMGLHPVYVKPETYQEELQFVYDRLQERKFAAVGEIGIDLYWDTSTLDLQQQSFEKQIQWAKDLDLPIVIHSRNSFDEIMEVLQGADKSHLKGIFHCFTGHLEQAQKVIDLGMKLGIGGVVTFKNGGINQWIHQIPLENIVLETDGPYLAPAPFRGKRNEPKYLQIIAQTLADLYKTDLEEVTKITTQNAHEVFVTY